jgi:hypothetical protein
MQEQRPIKTNIIEIIIAPFGMWSSFEKEARYSGIYIHKKMASVRVPHK